MLEYELIRSNRKTLALYVRPGGRVEVRAPLRMNIDAIDSFVQKKREWIESARLKLYEKQAGKKTIYLSETEEARLKKMAKECLLEKCRHYSEIMGLSHGEIRISGAKTRWGSCNLRGNINFTYRLIFVPEEAIDYVVVHELAHLKEMNHSAKFWSIVEQIMPDYRERRNKLREFEHRIEWRKRNETE